MPEITRRHILKWCGSVAAVPILYPFLSSMIKEAHGQSLQKPRYIKFVSSNGIFKKQIKDFGGRKEVDLTKEASLPDLFKPFDKPGIKEKMIIMSDFYCPFALDTHGNRSSLFDMLPGPNGLSGGGTTYHVGGQTLDRLIGERLGTDTPVQSLNFICAHYDKGQYFGMSNVSGDAYDQKYAADTAPLEAFNRLFAKPLNPTGPSAADLFEQKKSVLDFVAKDITQLESRLAGTERAKLQQFADSVRGLELQLEGLSKLACVVPEPPDAALDSLVNDAAVGIRREIADAFLEIAAVALSCNMTRSVNIEFEAGALDTYHKHVGISDLGFHLACHQVDVGNILFSDIAPTDTKRIHAADYITRVWHYFGEQIVGLYERLGEIPEGSGTVADSVFSMWMSMAGGKHHNGLNEHGIICLGDANGAFKTGQYLDVGDGARRFKGSEVVDIHLPPHSVSDAYVAILNGLGIKVDTFGDPAYCSEPINAILAT